MSTKKNDELKLKVSVPLTACTYFADVFDLTSCIFDKEHNADSKKQAKALSDRFKKAADKPSKKAVSNNKATIRFSADDVSNMLRCFCAYNCYISENVLDSKAGADDNIELTVATKPFSALSEELEHEINFLEERVDEETDDDKEVTKSIINNYSDLLDTMDSCPNAENDDTIVKASMSRDKVERMLNFAGCAILNLNSLCDSMSAENREMSERHERICRASKPSFKAMASFIEFVNTVSDFEDIDDIEEIIEEINNSDFCESELILPEE